jgi:hypothetical protein
MDGHMRQGGVHGTRHPGDGAAEVAGDQWSISAREGIDIGHHAGRPVHNMETVAK